VPLILSTVSPHSQLPKFLPSPPKKRFLALALLEIFRKSQGYKFSSPFPFFFRQLLTSFSYIRTLPSPRATLFHTRHQNPHLKFHYHKKTYPFNYRRHPSSHPTLQPPFPLPITSPPSPSPTKQALKHPNSNPRIQIDAGVASGNVVPAVPAPAACVGDVALAAARHFYFIFYFIWVCLGIAGDVDWGVL